LASPKNLNPSKLRAARTAAGLSRELLAIGAGVSASAVTRYETGHGVPGRDTLLRLAAALAVPIDDLVDPDLEAVAE
jgi:transcriptional regulator with XRE-family HTH domain